MNDQQANANVPEQDDLANEAKDRANTNENTDTSEVYLGDSSLQSGAEFQQDKNTGHSKESNVITSSGVDDLQSNSDGAAGTDRAGTAERKNY